MSNFHVPLLALLEEVAHAPEHGESYHDDDGRQADNLVGASLGRPADHLRGHSLLVGGVQVCGDVHVTPLRHHVAPFLGERVEGTRR